MPLRRATVKGNGGTVVGTKKVLSGADSALVAFIAFIPVSYLAVLVLSEADSAFPELLDVRFVEFIFPPTLSSKLQPI